MNKVWDPYDRDPHQDVMLKITPISGSAPSDYKLVMVIKFTVDGSGDTYYIPTLKQTADVYENPLWTAYYDGSHGSSTELHYYVNINDDNRLPTIHDLMRFDLELWRVDRYWGIIKKWDKKLVSGIDCYTISEPGHSETLKVDKKDASEQVIYEAKVKVETIGIEKANTIAIYKTNGTVFNGHYQEQERMNVIQLYVNDSGSGTPFEEGLNTIVIPTSLFTETIFNARVQNETLNETAIYSSDEEIFKFISVDRDGYTEQACDEIDFIIIRFDISSEDAMEVLNLLLKCLVNETTNETAIVYNYVSTKENGTAAVMMNLPFSVLGLIPWYCDFENSPMGSKPETFEDWFWKPLATIGMLIVGVIVTIGMAFVELFMMMVDFFAAIFMDILPIFVYILWLIIRAIIFIFVWIMFAITLLVLTALIGLLAIILLPIGVLLGWIFNYTINSIKTEGEEISLAMGYNINIEYTEFFDLWLPFLHFYFIVNSLSLINVNIKFFPLSIESVTTNEESPEQSSLNLLYSGDEDLGFQEYLKDTKSLEAGESFRESSASLKSSSSSPPDPYNPLEIISAIFSGMDDAAGIWSFTLYGAIISLTAGTFMSMPLRLILLIIPIVVCITTIILSLTIKQYTKYETFLYLIGASIISLFTALLIYKKGKPKSYDQFANQEYFKIMQELNTIKEFSGDILLDIAGVINDLVWSESFWGEFSNCIGDGILLYFSLEDWHDSLQCLEFASYVVPYYNSNWEYDVSMLAGFSLLGTAVLTIIAFTYLGVLPKADFIANVTTITEGDSVNFTYTGSENYTQQTYYWDFGDGTTSTGKDPIHIYETIGKFTVSVTVVDKDGDFDTETKTDYIEVTQ